MDGIKLTMGLTCSGQYVHGLISTQQTSAIEPFNIHTNCKMTRRWVE